MPLDLSATKPNPEVCEGSAGMADPLAGAQPEIVPSGETGVPALPRAKSFLTASGAFWTTARGAGGAKLPFADRVVVVVVVTLAEAVVVALLNAPEACVPAEPHPAVMRALLARTARAIGRIPLDRRENISNAVSPETRVRAKPLLSRRGRVRAR
jgi:hypothetical protein